MSATLSGTGVLVTRPVEQADTLCRLIEDRGGRAYRLPTIAIEPVTADSDLNTNDYDIVIFISRNAVSHGLKFLKRLDSGRAAVGAIGSATALALEQAGIHVTIGPGRTADSEGLLAVDELSDAKDKRILIVRGSGGREFLGDELGHRGARVKYAEVYRRICPEHPKSRVREMADALDSGAIRFVIANSVESLKNLVNIFEEAVPDAPIAGELVTASGRVVKEAEAMGFTGIPVLADAPVDEALVTAMESRIVAADRHGG